MKKRLGGLVATGVMAVGAFAGTAGAATASSPIYSGYTCDHIKGCFSWDGPFPISQNCVTFVASIHQLGVWDCEYFDPWPYFSSDRGWYATSRVIV